MSEIESTPQARSLDKSPSHKLTAAELLSVCMDQKPLDAKPDAAAAASGDHPPTARAEGEPAREAEASAAAKLGEPAVAENSKRVSPAIRREVPRDTGNHAGLVAGQLAGGMLTACGGLLLVLPKVSSQAGEFLAKFDGVRGQSGTLIVGGLCIFTVCVLLRALRGIRGSLDEVSLETIRLQGIAEDAESVRGTLDRVCIENRTLTREVVHLQGKLRRLIEIVSNPDYTASMFRLAASVDQLGKHVDISMKGQFAELQSQVVAIAQHAAQAERQLLAALGQIPALLKEQHKLQHAFAQKSFKDLQSSADLADARLDENLRTAARVEASLQDQQQALAANFGQLLEGAEGSASDLAACLNELRGYVGRLVADQEAAVCREFEQVVARLDLGEQNQSSGLAQLSEQIQAEVAARLEDLQERLDRLQDFAGRQHEASAAGLAGLSARLGEGAREQLAALETARERTAEELLAAKSALTLNLELLAAQLEELQGSQRADFERQAQHAQGLTDAAQRDLVARLADLERKVEEAAREQQSLTRESAKNLQSGQQTAQEELAARLEGLERKVGEAACEQQSLTRESVDHVQQDQLAARSELTLHLAQLESLIENQGSEQRSLAHALGANAQHNAEASNRGFVACVQELGQRIESLLAIRSDELTHDMLEIAAIFSNITEDVRACLAESIERPESPEADCADTVEGELDMLRAEAEGEMPPLDAGMPEPALDTNGSELESEATQTDRLEGGEVPCPEAPFSAAPEPPCDEPPCDETTPCSTSTPRAKLDVDPSEFGAGVHHEDVDSVALPLPGTGTRGAKDGPLDPTGDPTGPSGANADAANASWVWPQDEGDSPSNPR